MSLRFVLLTSRLTRELGASSSAVECFLAKEEVAGSNPVSRSNLR